MILRILATAAAGVVLGGVIGNIVTGDWTYSVVWSVALAAFILVAAVGGVSRHRVLSSGYALARVETVQRTGEGTAASQPVDVRLTVAPEGIAAYATTLSADVPVDRLRALTPGAIIVVSRPSPIAPDVALPPTEPADWTARAAAARLDPSAIPPASDVPDGRIRSVPRPLRARVAAVIIVIAVAAATLIPAYSSIGRGVENIVAGDWNGSNFVTGRYQQLAVDEIVAVAGTTQCTDIDFYDSYVIADCLTRPGADTTDEYQWRYGRAFREGPSFIQSTELQAELFDVKGLDFSMVAAVAREAVASSGLRPTSGPLAGVSRTDGAPTIHVYLSDDYKDANLVYSFEGAELNRSGSAFE